MWAEENEQLRIVVENSQAKMEDHDCKIQAESIVEAELNSETRGCRPEIEGEVATHLSQMGAACNHFPAVCRDGSTTGYVANISQSSRAQQHI